MDGEVKQVETLVLRRSWSETLQISTQSGSTRYFWIPPLIPTKSRGWYCSFEISVQVDAKTRHRSNPHWNGRSQGISTSPTPLRTRCWSELMPELTWVIWNDYNWILIPTKSQIIGLRGWPSDPTRRKLDLDADDEEYMRTVIWASGSRGGCFLLPQAIFWWVIGWLQTAPQSKV